MLNVNDPYINKTNKHINTRYAKYFPVHVNIKFI